MTLPPSHGSQQCDFFAQVESDLDQQKIAEISNALYERELELLANQGPNQLQLLRHRIASLSYYVLRSARFLASGSVPLTLDVHNASWQAKQAAKSPARTVQVGPTLNWYNAHAVVGQVVPIRLQEFDHEHIELDCIDRVQQENQTLHVNKFGWFDFNGDNIDAPGHLQALNNTKLNLLKPNKAIMTAACCGHSWNHKGKSMIRTLSLREILLVSHINWKNFSQMAKT